MHFHYISLALAGLAGLVATSPSPSLPSGTSAKRLIVYTKGKWHTL
jgi:hypothetical protein